MGDKEDLEKRYIELKTKYEQIVAESTKLYGQFFTEVFILTAADIKFICTKAKKDLFGR